MDKSTDTAARFPDWRPFNCANERFVRTPADSRLAPPMLVRETSAGPFKIVFPPAGEPARKRPRV